MRFIEFKEIPKNSVTIDVRTKVEYADNEILQYNIPIMSEKEHRMMKRWIIFAFLIIVYKIYQNRDTIDREFEKVLKESLGHDFVFGCSRGRLRSPLTAMYIAHRYKVRVYVIRGGVKYLKFKNDAINVQ